MGLRRLAAVGLAAGGAAAAAAPYLPWFRVTATASGRAAEISLAGTAYGTTMTLFGIFAVIAAVRLAWPGDASRRWPILAGVAMVFVLSAGLKGALDPTGGAKAALSENLAFDLVGLPAGDEFRVRLAPYLNSGELVSESLIGGAVAAAGAAFGLVLTVPLVVRGARGHP